MRGDSGNCWKRYISQQGSVRGRRLKQNHRTQQQTQSSKSIRVGVRKEICQASRMIPAPAPTTTTNTLVHQQNPTSYLCECDRNNDQKVESEGREVQMGGRDGGGGTARQQLAWARCVVCTANTSIKQQANVSHECERARERETPKRERQKHTTSVKYF
jgi:hypothetical protein